MQKKPLGGGRALWWWRTIIGVANAGIGARWAIAGDYVASVLWFGLAAWILYESYRDRGRIT